MLISMNLLQWINGIIRVSIITALLSVFLGSNMAVAGLYKGVDAEGNVVYSDKPFENSEQFTPPTITIMDAPRVPPPEEKPAIEEESPDETKYTSVVILSPKNQQTIWNEPNLIVRVKTKPELDIKAGHTLWLIMDGKPLVKKSRSLALPIGRADRGEHKLQVQIRNKKNRILKRSKPITVHIKNSVVPRRTPR